MATNLYPQAGSFKEWEKNSPPSGVDGIFVRGGGGRGNRLPETVSVEKRRNEKKHKKKVEGLGARKVCRTLNPTRRLGAEASHRLGICRKGEKAVLNQEWGTFSQLSVLLWSRQGPIAVDNRKEKKKEEGGKKPNEDD